MTFAQALAAGTLPPGVTRWTAADAAKRAAALAVDSAPAVDPPEARGLRMSKAGFDAFAKPDADKPVKDAKREKRGIRVAPGFKVQIGK